MAIEKGDIYTAEIGVVKVKKGVPTIIRMDGQTYILQAQIISGTRVKKRKGRGVEDENFKSL